MQIFIQAAWHAGQWMKEENAASKVQRTERRKAELMIRRDVILSAHRCAGIDAKKGLAGVAARVRPEGEACIFFACFFEKKIQAIEKRYKL